MPKTLLYYHLRLTLLLAFLFSLTGIKAQISEGCVFLQGDYIEVGIAPNGAFGTPANAPAGYHARPSPVLNSLYNPVTGTYQSRNTAVGFVADYGKDGWGVGTPGYFGDYFMPGAVQEGFSLQVDGVKSNAWSNNYQSNGSTGFTGTLTGANVSLTTTATDKKAVWQGAQGTLQVRQTLVLKKTKSYFTVNVVFKNTGPDTVRKIYYMRTVDPDNEVSITNGYVTRNKITYQLPNPYNKTLVTATGVQYLNAYLGLGTKDCQARCFFLQTGLFASANLESIYNGTGGYSYVDSSQGDVGIGVVFKVGDIAPGDSTTFSYAYILNESDLDEAFAETEPGFMYNGNFYPSGGVIVQPTGSVLPIDIVNGDYFIWSWAPPAFLDVTTGTHVNATVSTGPITYTVTGISTGEVANRCSNRTLSITVSPYPVSPPPSVTSPVVYCINQSASALTATGPGIMRWYTAATGGTGVFVPPVPSTASAGTTIWYATQEIGGVESIRVPVIVLVRSLPAITITPSSSWICYGDTTVLAASGTPASYTWAPSATLSANSGSIVKAFPLINTIYTISATDSFFCKNTKTIAIDVRPLPSVIVNPASGVICSGDSLQLTAGGSSISYLWDASGSLNTINGPQVISKPVLTTTYFVTGTDVNNCKKKVQVTIVVNPLPIPFLGADKSICIGSTAVLNPGNFNKYIWLDNSTQPVFNVNDIGTYWVNVENGFGCKASDTMKIISLYPLPVNFLPADTTFCRGNLLVLKVPGYNQYIWSDGTNKSSAVLKQFGKHLLTVKDKNGCSGTDSISLFDAHCTPFQVPNAFSPNQDGKNDAFRPMITQIVTGYKMIIFNRWGEEIFTTDIPQKGWDGYYKGYMQSSGTYIYHIKFIDWDGVPVQLKGTLNLIR